MNKVLIALLGIFVSTTALAQSNLLNAKSPAEIGIKSASQIENDNDSPLPYGFVNDRDILWQRIVWEKIDLDERINFPLYYPIDTNYVGNDRRSLFHVITKAASEGKIKLYGDSYFNQPLDFVSIEGSLQSQSISQRGIDILNDAGVVLDPSVRPLDVDTTYGIDGFDEYVNTVTVGADNVSEYRIKGVWYIDKRQSEMRYRILGLAPVTPDANFMEEEEGIELFWIYYPDARKILHDAKAFNTANSARPISFDHIMNSRRFNSVIYKMENVQGDREVERYIPENSMLQLLESERLREIVRNKEIDMWNY